MPLLLIGIMSSSKSSSDGSRESGSFPTERGCPVRIGQPSVPEETVEIDGVYVPVSLARHFALKYQGSVSGVESNQWAQLGFEEHLPKDFVACSFDLMPKFAVPLELTDRYLDDFRFHVESDTQGRIKVDNAEGLVILISHESGVLQREEDLVVLNAHLLNLLCLLRTYFSVSVYYERSDIPVNPLPLPSELPPELLAALPH